MKLKKTIGAMALATLFATMGASAVEKNITVTASVDPTLNLLQTDGSALPTSVNLTYSPAEKNFVSYTINTAVHTNDPDKDLVVKLASKPMLSNLVDSSDQIPLSVSWAGQDLSTSDVDISASTLNFGSTGVKGVSATQQLTINTSLSGNPPKAGIYQGIVSIILTQKT